MAPLEWLDVTYAAYPDGAAFRSLLRNATFKSAILAASPSLHRALEEINRGVQPKNRRAMLRLAVYAIRMATRPTPFGLFSSIGGLHTAETTTLRLSEESRRSKTRLDMAWTEKLAASIETSGNEELNLYLNPGVYEAGGRAFVYYSRLVSSSDGKTADYIPISLKIVDSVRRTGELALHGTTLGNLSCVLSSEFGVTIDRAQRLVLRLLDCGYLLSDCFAGPTDNPQSQLFELAQRYGHRSNDELQVVRNLLEDFDHRSTWATDSSALANIDSRLRRIIAWDGPVVQVDAFHDFTGALGRDVLAEALSLAQIGLRFSTTHDLRDYANLFRIRYEGTERLVPLMEMVDLEFGIGPPKRSLSEPNQRDEKDELRFQIATDALRGNAQAVKLDAATLDRLAAPLPRTSRDASFEASFVLEASTSDALRAGHYKVGFGQVGNHTPGQSLGRFLEGLPDSFATTLRGYFAEGANSDLLDVELVYRPVVARASNVASHPKLHRYELRVGLPEVETDDSIITPRDVLVGLLGNRFILWSKKHGRRLRIHESTMLSPSAAPGIVRFLSLVGRTNMRSPVSFDWRTAGSLPALPRLEYGKLVLSTARWQYSSEDGKRFDRAEFNRWRLRWNVPRYVLLALLDRRLVIDLDSALGLEILADQSRESGRLILEECFPRVSSRWFTGDTPTHHYATEFVVSRGEQPIGNDDVALDTMKAALPEESLYRTCRVLAPGSEWVYAKIYTGQQRADIVLEQLVPAIDGLPEMKADEAALRYFVRYSEPRPNIRIRICSGPAHSDVIRSAMTSWLQASLASGLVDEFEFATYTREIERYGGLDGIRLAERMFHEDTTLTVQSLRGIELDDATRLRLAVETLRPLVRGFCPLGNYAAWLLGGTRRRKLSKEQWEVVRQIRTGLDHPETPFDRSAREIANTFRELASAGRLVTAIDELFRSFVHMHFNRFGIHGDAEFSAREQAVATYHRFDRISSGT